MPLRLFSRPLIPLALMLALAATARAIAAEAAAAEPPPPEIASAVTASPPATFPGRTETYQRCTAPDGHVTLSNVGCAPGQRRESHTVTPNVMDSRDLREWARRNPPRRESAVRERSNPPRQVRVRDSIACENAKRAYRFEAGSPLARRGSLGPLREEVRQACSGS